MDVSQKGTILYRGVRRMTSEKLAEMEAAIATPTAGITATLVPFFGSALAGDEIVSTLGLDLGRSLLVGLDYEWHRPVQPDEALTIEVSIADVYSKASADFAVVATEARDHDGKPVQRQVSTFMERKPS
jgi:hypothetical protein